MCQLDEVWQLNVFAFLVFEILEVYKVSKVMVVTGQLWKGYICYQAIEWSVYESWNKANLFWVEVKVEEALGKIGILGVQNYQSLAQLNPTTFRKSNYNPQRFYFDNSVCLCTIKQSTNKLPEIWFRIVCWKRFTNTSWSYLTVVGEHSEQTYWDHSTSQTSISLLIIKG